MTRPSIDAIDMLLARATFAVDVTSRGATIATEELIAELPALLAYVRELEREHDAAALAMREKCAQACLQGNEAAPANTWETGFKAAMRSCAAAIRGIEP